MSLSKRILTAALEAGDLWAAPLTHDWGWEELLLPQAFRGFAQQFSVAPIVTLTLGMLPRVLQREMAAEWLKLANAITRIPRMTH
jgi:hypothetical protein